MDGRYDEGVELKFLNAQIDKLQKELLDLENVALPESERIVVDIKNGIELRKKRLEDFRIKRIRISAVIEESKNVLKE